MFTAEETVGGTVTAEDVAAGGCVLTEVAAGGTEVWAGADATLLEACVVLLPIALAWNAANLSPGLIAKTIPC